MKTLSKPGKRTGAQIQKQINDSRVPCRQGMWRDRAKIHFLCSTDGEQSFLNSRDALIVLGFLPEKTEAEKEIKNFSTLFGTPRPFFGELEKSRTFLLSSEPLVI